MDGGALSGLLSLHADDIALTGSEAFISSTTSSIRAKYPVSTDEVLTNHLSVQVKRSANLRHFTLTQTRYIEDLVGRFFDSSPLPCHRPYIVGFGTLVPSPDSSQSDPRYNSLIGALLWISQCSRPDVSFAVNRLSQFLKNNDHVHFTAALRVLAYLFHTRHLGLVLGGSECVLRGYSDLDWAENRVDRSSTSGFLFRLADGSISWKSRKQRTTALSSTEAEYIALSDAAREAMWLRQVLQEIHLIGNDSTPLSFDNTGSGALAQNPSHHARSKHIDVRYHHIRGLVKDGSISLCHVPSASQLADCFTKPLPRPGFQAARERLGVCATRTAGGSKYLS